MKGKRSTSILALAPLGVLAALTVCAATRDAHATASRAPAAVLVYPSSIAAIGHTNTNGYGVKGLIAVSSATVSSGAETTQPFVVTSTVDGKPVLPHRIVWRGVPKLPAAQVSKVEFLIDGKVRWIEQNPPYTYGDDSNWLVTSWLSPGRHTFTVRAKAKDGRTALRTTTARVLPAPPPPDEVSGSWKHSFGGSGATPGGTWVLTVDRTGWKILDPGGDTNFIDVAYFSGGRLQARGGIFTKLNSRVGGNGWCHDLNAPVNYRWAVSADTLTLTHFGPDRCGKGADKQHYLWNGAWTKAG